MTKIHMTDDEWFEKHREELDKVNKMMENLEKNKKIQKLHKKFMENKYNKFSYNSVKDESNDNIKSVFSTTAEIKNDKIPYFEYVRGMNLDKRFG